MDCKHAQVLMDLALTDDSSLSPDGRAALKAHLSVCEACRDEYLGCQQALELVRRHGQLSPDTIQLLEAACQEVPDRPRPVPEETLEIPDAQVEAGLTRLMAMIDQQEPAQGPHRPMTLEEGVADLRRRVNTVEAYQIQWREQWRHAGSQESLASPSRWQKSLRYAAGIAACLAVVVSLGWFNLRPPQQPAGPLTLEMTDTTALVQWVTADGMKPCPVDEPIQSGDQHRELLLGGQHRVVMNTGTTAIVDAEDGAYTIDLAQGELYVEVVPGASDGFEVRTPNARLTITGTKFNVRTGGQQTELTLLKGSVRFVSLEGRESVDVLAGQASSVVGRSAPIPPRSVDALAATAWAREVQLGVRHTLTAADPLLGRSDLEGLLPDALVAGLPDYRHWTYERFRDEMRPWFDEQFPWVMTWEKTLNEDHQADADYFDVLVVSGDIWQFRYQGFNQASSPAPAFHPSAAERLANWYGLDNEALIKAVGYRSNTQALADHTGAAFAAAIQRWRADIARAKPEQSDDLALFTLKAAIYLNRTRAAAYHWIREHPEQTQRLLARAGYADAFIAPLLPPTGREPLGEATLLTLLGSQIDACAGSYQQAQQLLLTPRSKQCPADEWTQLQKHLDQMLTPLSETGVSETP